MYRSCILAIMILFSFFKQSPKVKATLNVTQTICSFYKLYKKTNNNNNIVDNFHWTKTITSAQLTSSVSRDTFTLRHILRYLTYLAYRRHTRK